MPLSVRPKAYVVPRYSLTGDLLAFLRCGLQYRYQNRGALPPSKPVQQWFGEFIHGVMEEAYRVWKSGGSPLPWSDAQIRPIIDLVIRRLAARGVYFQRYLLLGIAVERAIAAINVWGEHLFPLITEAEIPLRGIRPMPAGTESIRLSNYYEVEGVVDVITSVRLAGAGVANPIVGAVLNAVTRQTYEVIVDYKGMRRPGKENPEDETWHHQEWQVLTYAWLRQQQNPGTEVQSCILLYLNELVPSVEDMEALYKEVFGKGQVMTDLPPQDSDLEVLRTWPRDKAERQERLEGWPEAVGEWWRAPVDSGKSFPRLPPPRRMLSAEYRRQRSFRLVTVDADAIADSLDEFDRVVGRIESSVAAESRVGSLNGAWQPNPREETCTVCDFKTYCPAPGNVYRGVPTAP